MLYCGMFLRVYVRTCVLSSRYPEDSRRWKLDTYNHKEMPCCCWEWALKLFNIMPGINLWKEFDFLNLEYVMQFVKLGKQRCWNTLENSRYVFKSSSSYVYVGHNKHNNYKKLVEVMFFWGERRVLKFLFEY